MACALWRKKLIHYFMEAADWVVGYEAGQSGVGNHFSWFVNPCFPKEYHEASAQAKMDIHGYLTDNQTSS